MRLEPKKIDMDPQSPWDSDQLDLKATGETLTKLVRNVEGPLVMGLTAPWGFGKSTFLNLWATDLENCQQATVLRYNAWETDAANDAFLALLSALQMQMQMNGSGKYKLLIETTIRIGVGLASSLIPAGVSTLTGAPLLGDIAKKGTDWVQDKLNDQGSIQEKIKQFRESLQDLGTKLKEDTGFPLVVVVDELDRCRPDYAISTLEIIKHLFNVDSVVFVLGVHSDQLAESVRGCYGQSFDGAGYLRRFFNLTIALPEPNLKKFIQYSLGKLDIEARQQFRYEVGDQKKGTFSIDLLAALAQSYDLSLRDVERLIGEVGLYHSSLNMLNRSLMDLCSWLITLRYCDRLSFEKALSGQFSAGEAWKDLEQRGFVSNLSYLDEAAYFRWCLEGFFHGKTGIESMMKELIEAQSGEEGPDRDDREWVQALIDTFDIFNYRIFEPLMYKRMAPYLRMFQVS